MTTRHASRMHAYENTPKAMEKYTNVYEPFLVEVMAVRTWQCLNGCVSLDWTYENCVVYTIFHATRCKVDPTSSKRAMVCQ